LSPSSSFSSATPQSAAALVPTLSEEVVHSFEDLEERNLKRIRDAELRISSIAAEKVDEGGVVRRLGV
jgi:hypothetical protein